MLLMTRLLKLSYYNASFKHYFVTIYALVIYDTQNQFCSRAQLNKYFMYNI